MSDQVRFGPNRPNRLDAYNAHTHITIFLSRVSILTRNIDIAILSFCLSVCPSVCRLCPSVMFRYSMETHLTCCHSVCRAMLCISAAYAVMRCLSVCLTVCLSVRYVRDHVKTNKRIFKIFSPSGRFIILVFLCQTAYIAIFRRGPPPPLTAASNAGGWALIAILSLLPAISAATGKVLSTGSPVGDSHRLASCDTSLQQ